MYGEDTFIANTSLPSILRKRTIISPEDSPGSGKSNEPTSRLSGHVKRHALSISNRQSLCTKLNRPH